MDVTNEIKEQKNLFTAGNIIQFILFSLFGIWLVFINVEINGVKSIPIDHAIKFIKTHFNYPLKIYACVMTLIGVFLPLFRGTWKRNSWSKFFQIMKFFAVPFTVFFFFNIGPMPFMSPKVIPFFFPNVIMQGTMVLLTGSIALGFLAKFGLFEFVGVFVRPVMRKLFYLPGKAAVNAVSSFVGSFTIGAIITNSLYRDGKYTQKELGILLTGFGTNSATFLIIMATTAGTMSHWTLVFWASFIICAVLTAITCRLYPLRKLPDTYAEGVTPDPEVPFKESVFKKAMSDALVVTDKSGGLFRVLKNSIIEGFEMTWGLMPIMASLSIFALVILYFTPVFDVLGYIGYPFARLLGYGQDALIVGKAVIVELMDVVVPCAYVKELDIVTRLTITVISMTTIIFFCGSMPAFLGTDSKLTVVDYMIIGLERALLGFIIVTLVMRGFALLGVI